MVLSEVTKSVCHVERNLKCLKDMPRISVQNIRDFRGAFKKKQRVGRGPGSGRGKTSGKGHKGQGQRGTMPRIGFEGGQTPFYRLVPKHGFTNAKFKKEYTPVSLGRLQYFIDSKRIDPNEKITIETLWRSGAVSHKIKDGVRILGTGATWFQGKIDIEVSRATQSAIEAIERNGGNIKTVYHDKIALRALLKPEKYDIRPRAARPSHKHILFYADAKNRGYLAHPDEISKLKEENKKLGSLVEQVKDLNIS